MSRAEFQTCLAALRLAPKDAARLLSVDPKTITRWLRGEIEVPGPAEQALRAWMQLQKWRLPWRPAEQMVGLTEEEVANQIELLREHNIGLADVLRRVRDRGGPAAPWKVDRERQVAELSGTMEVGYYLLPNGGFSPATYWRMDRESDFERDRFLIEDAMAAIADALLEGAIADAKREARANGLTDEDIDAELEAWRAEA